MSRYWSSLTRAIEPYVPGEQPQDGKYIKLNTNENPYPPSPKVMEAIREAEGERLRLYPHPECSALRKTIAEYYGLAMEQVFTGNGSDEVLAFAFRAFFERGLPVVFPDITYTFYPVYCQLFELDYSLAFLDNDFRLGVDMFKGQGGAVLANPNAPTGIFVGLDNIRRILELNRGKVVILDEAYVDFGGTTSVSLINEYDNLLVVQTASKGRSLAGLRVGWALGSKELVEGLKRIRDSFNSYTLDWMAIVAAQASFDDDAYFKATTMKIQKTRDAITPKLQEMGFNVCDSKANFVFVTHPGIKASELYKALKDRGILVRYFDRPRISNYLRITIGTDYQMTELLKAFEDIVTDFQY